MEEDINTQYIAQLKNAIILQDNGTGKWMVITKLAIAPPNAQNIEQY